MSKKYCFAQDEDSHLYIIPVEEKESFAEMMEKAYEDEDFDEFEEKFGKYRKGMHFTNYCFSDPEEIDE